MLLGKDLRNTLLYAAIIHMTLPYYTRTIKSDKDDSKIQKDTLELINKHLNDPLPGLVYTIFIVLISTIIGGTLHII
tara:strand:+ start:1257 stop:1487 length:231 start_codon:yes stop_codon:yes gene_type:complete